jgi:hypothetical protein
MIRLKVTISGTIVNINGTNYFKRQFQRLCTPRRAGIFVRRIVIPGAGHFWSSDPFENDPNSYGATAAPRLLLFLESAL